MVTMRGARASAKCETRCIRCFQYKKRDAIVTDCICLALCDVKNCANVSSKLMKETSRRCIKVKINRINSPEF